MRLRAAAFAPLPLLAVLCICTPSDAARDATTSRASTTGTVAGLAPGTLTRSAHISFENCIARHITLSVTVPRHAFTPSEAVRVTVSLRNTGATTCGPVTQQAVPSHRPLTVGPCGTLSLVVRTASGAAIFPGPVAYHCPLEVGFRLDPHSTATAVGTWDQTESLPQKSPGVPRATVRHAPPGAYRLVVDGVAAVPVVLARG